ncbi:alanyl-tRNA editing protein [Amaricoccus sp.]|uniref:alanyl-tRNA editing protein n=1 Tax=Amaricoccus sp. TaxID=1872485 RepID=UPI001B43DE19|nr:alanyl-tRNA editing protein [Amaricoccus sp.]MBP7000025.1 alanyl-tRNA editing protein [Amaricoccus sp.]
MTEYLFRDDAYLAESGAVATASGPEGVEFNRTIFYAASGGQPGDVGAIILADGREAAVIDTVHPEGDRTRILHRLAEGAPLPAVGEAVRLRLDMARRKRLMRVHTALHLLSVVLPFPVTGGAIGEAKGRLDFDMAEPPPDLAAVEAALNALVVRDLAVTAEWITDAEMEARPELVRTMKVKPPTGQGRVRLIRIGAGDDTVDLQPCGGTHVARTGEIGRLAIGKVEKKGRENRRVHLLLAAPA